VEREPKPAPVKRPRDGPSVACPDLRRFMCRRMPCACVYIRPPSPPTSSSHVEGLNCDPLLREFCAAFAYLNAWQACCPPPGGAFLAVERVTEPVLRVRVIRSHSTTMPCDVSSSFPPSPNQAEVPVCGVLLHTCVPRAKPCARATRELSWRNVERRVLSASRPSHTIRVFSVTVGQ
jgi:hypothetical protein